MKLVDKEPLLDALEKRVEQHIQQAIEVYQNLDSTTLLAPAADGGWSIAQCLAHLNSYGTYYLPLIKQGLDKHQHTVAGQTFRSSWFGRYFTRMMEPATGKKKYKAFKNHTPARDLDAHAVVAEFITQQEVLLACLSQARQADLNRVTIPISILKWVQLNVGDVFQFVIAHNERHMAQARRNLV